MNEDWHQKARKVREELDRPEKERLAKQLKKEREREAKQKEGRRKELERWAKRKGFVCSVCGATAKKPAQGEYVEETEYSGYYKDDWNKPGDLYKCLKCKNWTCKDHIDASSEICQSCAEKYG